MILRVFAGCLALAFAGCAAPEEETTTSAGDAVTERSLRHAMYTTQLRCNQANSSRCLRRTFQFCPKNNQFVVAEYYDATPLVWQVSLQGTFKIEGNVVKTAVAPTDDIAQSPFDPPPAPPEGALVEDTLTPNESFVGWALGLTPPTLTDSRGIVYTYMDHHILFPCPGMTMT